MGRRTDAWGGECLGEDGWRGASREAVRGSGDRVSRWNGVCEALWGFMRLYQALWCDDIDGEIRAKDNRAGIGGDTGWFCGQARAGPRPGALGTEAVERVHTYYGVSKREIEVSKREI